MTSSFFNKNFPICSYFCVLRRDSLHHQVSKKWKWKCSDCVRKAWQTRDILKLDAYQNDIEMKERVKATPTWFMSVDIAGADRSQWKWIYSELSANTVAFIICRGRLNNCHSCLPAGAIIHINVINFCILSVWKWSTVGGRTAVSWVPI